MPRCRSSTNSPMRPARRCRPRRCLSQHVYECDRGGGQRDLYSTVSPAPFSFSLARFDPRPFARVFDQLPWTTHSEPRTHHALYTVQTLPGRSRLTGQPGCARWSTRPGRRSRRARPARPARSTYSSGRRSCTGRALAERARTFPHRTNLRPRGRASARAAAGPDRPGLSYAPMFHCRPVVLITAGPANGMMPQVGPSVVASTRIRCWPWDGRHAAPPDPADERVISGRGRAEHNHHAAAAPSNRHLAQQERDVFVRDEEHLSRAIGVPVQKMHRVQDVVEAATEGAADEDRVLPGRTPPRPGRPWSASGARQARRNGMGGQPRAPVAGRPGEARRLYRGGVGAALPGLQLVHALDQVRGFLVVVLDHWHVLRPPARTGSAALRNRDGWRPSRASAPMPPQTRRLTRSR